MAEIVKYQSSECLRYIRHNRREIPAGKSYQNESIDTTLTPNNYSLVNRGTTAKECNDYRKKIAKDCFTYKRKNLVHGVEVVVQCPDDCPAEEKEIFFHETYNYICSTLPMGERCVFVAQVHTDEHKYITKPDGTKEDISKDHLHVMYVPAVPDHKHENFEYKLCADELTKRAKLKAFHPGLQKHLDDCGIHATVYRKKSGDGKNIALSVAQLKEITNKTGIVIKKSLTIDELATILQENHDIKLNDKTLEKKVEFYQNKATELSVEVKSKENTIAQLKDEIVKRDDRIFEMQNSLSQNEEKIISAQTNEAELNSAKSELNSVLMNYNSIKMENQNLNQMLQQKNVALQEITTQNQTLSNDVVVLKQALQNAQEKIKSVEQKHDLTSDYVKQIGELQATISSLQKELSQSKEKIASLEQSTEIKQPSIEVANNDTWGQANTWGNDKTWGTNTINHEEEKLW